MFRFQQFFPLSHILIQFVSFFQHLLLYPLQIIFHLIPFILFRLNLNKANLPSTRLPIYRFRLASFIFFFQPPLIFAIRPCRPTDVPVAAPFLLSIRSPFISPKRPSPPSTARYSFNSASIPLPLISRLTSCLLANFPID